MVPLRWISTRAASLAVVFLETVGSLGVRGSTGSALGWDLLLEGLGQKGQKALRSSSPLPGPCHLGPTSQTIAGGTLIQRVAILAWGPVPS